MLIDELLTYLFDGKPHLLATPMATWLASSRRFTAFINTFHNKIRKKLRATQEMERLLDLRLELETAYLLLQERSLSLVYEPPTGAQSRGPDFAVTYTTSTFFMVEVTRGLAQAQEMAPPLQTDPIHPRSLAGEWLADMVCSKLSQLLPKHTNILLVGVESPSLTQDSLRAAMLNLQQRAERNDASVVQRNGFRDRAHFFQHYQRLSELLVRGPHLQAGEPVIGWVNPQAKYPLPGKVRTVLYRSLNT
ncbi:MAG: hypothetical protein H7246_15030 [Phycisphaerae bacterium]|nr:hypothetical protein [Saprospiraceae bacterium]